MISPAKTHKKTHRERITECKDYLFPMCVFLFPVSYLISETLNTPFFFT